MDHRLNRSGNLDRFLKHVERTRVLLHLVEVQPIDGSDPLENYEAIREELLSYSPKLAEKIEIVALNKMDLLSDDEQEAILKRFKRSLRTRGTTVDVLPLSGLTRVGLDELLKELWSLLKVEGIEAPKWSKPQKQ